MKKRLLVSLLLCAALLAGCGAEAGDGEQAGSIGPKRSSSAEKEAQTEAVRSAVEQALSDTFDGELSVKVRTDRVEVSVLLSDPAYSADAQVPPDWAEVKAETARTTLSLREALSDLGDYRALIYLMDQQEAILLTAFNGKAAFDKFEKRSRADGEDGLTFAGFEAVLEGMTYEEVCALLGGEGELLAAQEEGEAYTEIYSWSGGDGESATVVFENGAVASKTQSGLEPASSGFTGPAASNSPGGVMVFPSGGSSMAGMEVEVFVTG